MVGDFDPTSFLRNDKVLLTPEKFNLFWNDRLNSGFYILELVKYIIESLKSRKVPGVSLEQAISTLHMLMYVEFFYDHEEKFHQCLKEASKKWKQIEDNLTILAHKQLHKIITCVLRVFKRKEDLLPDIQPRLVVPQPGSRLLKYKVQELFGSSAHWVSPSRSSD